MTTQDHNFTVHPHILFSIIQNQAGSLGKALLEGIMNSIDAAATRVSVTLGANGFTVRDDGRGFQSREEVLNWFGQFGTPHTQGDAVYGKFRMGRGQMMAFGVNSWRTGTFRMDVDIKGRGLDYRLTEKLAPVKGCRIEGTLYEPLTASALDEVITEFTQLVRYAQIPVSLNGRVISKRPELQTWDAETEDAFIKTTRNGDLLVYNLGVLVRSYPQYQFGCGGVVVSKRPLEVNFARNDVLLHKCETWRRISARLKRENMAKVASKAFLNGEERSFLAKQLTYGNIEAHMGLPVEDLKLFTDASGRHHSLRDLRAYSRVTAVSEERQRTGARLHREGHAFVLAQETLERFRVESVEDLVEMLESRTGRPLGVQATGFDALASECDESFAEHADSELTPLQSCVLQALREQHDKFFQWFSAAEKSSGQRTLKAGASNVAMAWTDGRTHIVFDCNVLERSAARGAAGFFELLMTLVHEYCHDSADFESHSHDLTFYNKHHDIVQYRSGRLVAMSIELNARFERLARKAGLTVASKRPARSRKEPRPSAALRGLQEFRKKQIPLFDDQAQLTTLA